MSNQLEKNRLAQIEADKKAEADKIALSKAPDQEKVKAWYATFKELKFPELTSEPGKAMSARVNEALSMVRKLIVDDSKTLL